MRLSQQFAKWVVSDNVWCLIGLSLCNRFFCHWCGMDYGQGNRKGHEWVQMHTLIWTADNIMSKLPGFRSLGGQGFRFYCKRQVLVRNHNPHRLNHFLWKSVEGCDHQRCSGKNKETPQEWDVTVNTVLHFRAYCDVWREEIKNIGLCDDRRETRERHDAHTDSG